MVFLMISYTQGNLLDANTDAIVNTVNEVGVMGKGIALMFREAFPDNAERYIKACKAGDVKVGQMFVTNNPELMGPRWIINFPTKRHWRHPSKLQWIRDGLADLARVIEKHKIRSIALPPLGCGNGGLEWLHVRREIQMALNELEDVEVLVYQPTNVYYNAKKRAGAADLTPPRALVAEMIRRYSILGFMCTNLEVQKMAWFLYRITGLSGLGDPFDLRFAAHKYGPYADRLRHMLNNLDGSYLTCEKRLSDAGPMDPIAFNEDRAGEVSDYIHTHIEKPLQEVLEKTSGLIDGFQSPLGMELLATVDWLLAKENCDATILSIKEGLRQWPGGATAGKRKLRIFPERAIEIALERVSPLSAP
jgi:O-acetyl-ADP-ribose deacetylase (regulator of RNase III)